ncbi:MAG: hypothetical protein COU34_01730 [Candidatus Magasanikbacteria bacterium CG10_big_fil_rev_8_21_14_0_10_43_9]|nr:MAG: hypothetical protein COU34_01730 [Candidatus Magasanikbacteria bacterium CG10_big_fil_rev_8_21_14_0_10_43_9]
MDTPTKTTDQKIDDLTKMVGEVFDVVTFIKDTAATQESVDELRKEMNDRFLVVDSSFGQAADERVDIKAEIRSVRAELEEIKKELAKLEERTREDSDAVGSSDVYLIQRVSMLEKRVKTLENKNT